MTDINEAYRVQFFNSTEQYPSLLYSNKITDNKFNKMFEKKFDELLEKKFDELFEKKFDELIEKKFDELIENKMKHKESYLTYIFTPFQFMSNILSNFYTSNKKTEPEEIKSDEIKSDEIKSDDKEICLCGYKDMNINDKVPIKYDRQPKNKQMNMQVDNDEYSGSVYMSKDREEASKKFMEFMRNRDIILEQVYKEM